MKLTPLEIRKMDFSKSLRGYNADEVRAFLEIVAEQVEALQREVNNLSDQVVRMETRLADFQMMEKTLQDTLLKAEETAQRSRADSQREAELILREAQLSAQQIMIEARQSVERLQGDILTLLSRKDAFIKKLKYLLQSQQDLVDVLNSQEFEADAETAGRPHEQPPPAVS
ncbi:MAG TPA: DivIVA domain-containing protein [bacterium]